MRQQSPIFVKTETFIVWLLAHTGKYPKSERFRLALRIEDAIFALHEHLIRAAQVNHARQELLEADIELDKLRSYLRLSHESHLMNADQFGYSASQTTEIGKLLGAWIKTTTS
jgi:hypothetical protein